MRWLRPWLPYEECSGQIWCLVCVYPDQTERAQRRHPGSIVVASHKCRTRKAVMRFFRHHSRCAPHAW